MRILFSCVGAYGHFHPLIPLASALVEREHEVAFATSPAFGERIEAGGFRFFAAGLTQAELEEDFEHRARLRELPIADRRPYAYRWRFAEIDSPARLPALRQAADTWEPELMIHESSEVSAGPLVAASLDLPSVNHNFGRMIPRACLEGAAGAMEPLWSLPASARPALRRVSRRVRRHLPAELPDGDGARGNPGAAGPPALPARAQRKRAGMARRAAAEAHRLRHPRHRAQRPHGLPDDPRRARGRRLLRDRHRWSGERSRAARSGPRPMCVSDATWRRPSCWPTATSSSRMAAPARRLPPSHTVCRRSCFPKGPTSSRTPISSSSSARGLRFCRLR